MKGLTREKIIQILQLKQFDFCLKSDMESIFEKFGDDYYINRDNGEWELCNKNDKFPVIKSEF